MSLQERWREQADAIRAEARPLVARADEIKAKMKHANEFESEALLVELQQLNHRIGSAARQANDADAAAREHAEALR